MCISIRPWHKNKVQLKVDHSRRKNTMALVTFLASAYSNMLLDLAKMSSMFVVEKIMVLSVIVVRMSSCNSRNLSC